MSTSKYAHSNKTPAQKDQYFQTLRNIHHELNPTVVDEEKKGEVYPTNNNEIQKDIEHTVEIEEEFGATDVVAKKKTIKKTEKNAIKKPYQPKKKPKFNFNLNEIVTYILAILTTVLIPFFMILYADTAVIKEKISNLERGFNVLESKLEKSNDRVNNTVIDVEIMKRSSNKKSN